MVSKSQPCHDHQEQQSIILRRIALLVQNEDSVDAKDIAAILAEEKVELLPEEDIGKLTELDSLTGQPRPDDILLYAIPVSGHCQKCRSCAAFC